ncbi:DUF397 domain-containing protein [Nonomuraea typhae]|uniref:DUF397 domain-containing protein n=1 Tax=Nonomuraea typhae TaxID=2603600 RepID=A0ABW7YJD8_9ACTN
MAVTIPDDAEWRMASNGGGNCVQMTAVVLPPEHPKHGRGKTVAVRDSENPAAGVQIYTGDEIRFFAEGIKNGIFADLI